MRTLFTFFITGLGLSAYAGITVSTQGDAYLRFLRDGRAVYATKAELKLVHGRLCGPGSTPVLPEIHVGEGFTINEKGEVSLEGKTVARLILAQFPEGSYTTLDGDFLIASDRPTYVYAGAAAHALLVGGRPTTPALPPTSPAPTPVITAKPAITTKVVPVTAPQKADTGKPLIKVMLLSTVNTSKITLGQIADIQAGPELKDVLSQIEVCSLPVLGIPKALNETWIWAKIKSLGYSPEFLKLEVPPSASVVRESQTLAGATVNQIALAAATEATDKALSLRLQKPEQDTIYPAGKLEAKVDGISNAGSSVVVLVGIYLDDQKVTSRSLTFTPDPNAPRIRAGSKIKICIRANGACVEVPGRARNEGVVGQTISVVTDGNITFEGKVMNSSQVEVKL